MVYGYLDVEQYNIGNCWLVTRKKTKEFVGFTSRYILYTFLAALLTVIP
jgi:hypothetical protein